MALPLSPRSGLSLAMATTLPLLLALLGTTPGLGAPRGGCGVPPSAWCQDWVTALRCGALGRCPHLTQGHPEVDVCALCQQLVGFLRHISNQSSVEVPVGLGDRGTVGVTGGPPWVPLREPGAQGPLWVSWWLPASATQGGATGGATVADEGATAGATATDATMAPCDTVVLDQVLGVLCPPLPFAAPPCRALLRALLHRLLCEIQHLEPRQVCATLKLCRGELGAVPVPEVPGDRPQGSAGPGLSPRALPVPVPLCWMCRTLVARAEAAVPVGSVAAAVARLCRALPLPAVGACQCLAERYAALAIEGLLGRLGPRLLCRLLLACRSGDGWDGWDGWDEGDKGDTEPLPPPRVLEAAVVRLAECTREEDPKGPSLLSLPLGPCALGPKFWCSSLETARHCQALQHCQEHVWL